MAKNKKPAQKDGADKNAQSAPAEPAPAPKPAPKSQPPAGSVLAKLMESQRKKRDEDRAKKDGKLSDHSATRSHDFGPKGGPNLSSGPKGGGSGAVRRTAPGG
jgi:hypothetical protein